MYPTYGTLDQAMADLNKVLELSQEQDLRSTAQKMIEELPTLPTLTPTP